MEDKSGGNFKSPFELDAQESLDNLGSGLKTIFKKTKNVVNKFENLS